MLLFFLTDDCRVFLVAVRGLGWGSSESGASSELFAAAGAGATRRPRGFAPFVAVAVDSFDTRTLFAAVVDDSSGSSLFWERALFLPAAAAVVVPRGAIDAENEREKRKM